MTMKIKNHAITGQTIQQNMEARFARLWTECSKHSDVACDLLLDAIRDDVFEGLSE